MKDFFKIGLLTFGLIFSANAVAGWNVWLVKDQMTGEAIGARADSSWTAPTIRPNSPYHELKARIQLSCSAKLGVNVSISLSQPLTLHGKSWGDGSLWVTGTTRIKWDDYIEKVSFDHAAPPGRFLQLNDAKHVVRELDRSNTLLLELKSQEIATVYFKFPLSGSSAALKELRAKCSKL